MYKLEYAPIVLEAKKEGRPLLALESTIITHGMPYPQNIEMVQKVETLALEQGVTPATIAVIDGVIHIGLTHDQLVDLAQRKNVAKLSRADIAYTIAAKKTGATTVAATMILAKLAGIAVFATGGTGGVHRGAEHSFDISADLHELSKTPVIVVAAGAKAILDLPKTFETLETLGVPVVTLGVNEIPAFYSRQSGIQSNLVAQNTMEIAHMFAMQKSLGLDQGVLVANPIPEISEIPKAEITPIIESALAHAEQSGIKGKAVTPYLLDQIYQKTAGRSLEANIALVLNNVLIGAQIAQSLHEITQR